MLNESSVREQLNNVRAALAKLGAERTALEAIEQSLVRWLDLHGEPHSQLPLAPTHRSNGAPKNRSETFKPLGAIAFAKAVIRGLRNRAGIVMTTSEVLSAALEMGAVTKAKAPLKVVEWILYDAVKKGSHPIRKSNAPHTWVYLEPAKQESFPSDPFTNVRGTQLVS
jgi:hypothetical protein